MTIDACFHTYALDSTVFFFKSDVEKWAIPFQLCVNICMNASCFLIEFGTVCDFVGGMCDCLTSAGTGGSA